MWRFFFLFLHINGVIRPWDLDRVALRHYITTEQAPDDVSLGNLFINTKRNMIPAAHQLLLSGFCASCCIVSHSFLMQPYISFNFAAFAWAWAQRFQFWRSGLTCEGWKCAPPLGSSGNGMWHGIVLNRSERVFNLPKKHQNRLRQSSRAEYVKKIWIWVARTKTSPNCLLFSSKSLTQKVSSTFTPSSTRWKHFILYSGRCVSLLLLIKIC